MGARPSTRAVSITIGYIVLLAALLVIRLGRQHLFPVEPPADTAPPVVSQPPAPPAGSPTRTEAPTAIETPTRTEPLTTAAAPAPAAPSTKPEKVEAPIARSRSDKPETASAPAPVTAPPLVPMTAATSGDTRATPDVDRTDTAIVPPPALPEASADPGRIGESVEAVALPRAVDFDRGAGDRSTRPGLPEGIIGACPGTRSLRAGLRSSRRHQRCRGLAVGGCQGAVARVRAVADAGSELRQLHVFRLRQRCRGAMCGCSPLRAAHRRHRAQDRAARLDDRIRPCRRDLADHQDFGSVTASTFHPRSTLTTRA